eukprot:5556526-Amphidinium_carterae.1
MGRMFRGAMLAGRFVCASQLFASAAAFTLANREALRLAVIEWMSNELVWEDKYARYGDINLWDTSNVTDMSGLFEGVLGFNFLIGGWNTSQVTNMSHMFAGAFLFNQDIGDWNTTKVQDMSCMFCGANMFSGQGIGKWDTSR